ncbi:MAG: hypothetical protein AAFY26_24835 [Cyanobacteria bacterium J06638_22]
MSWIWDQFQQRQIRDGQRQADEARVEAKIASRAIAELEEKVDRLSLLRHALFEELQQVSGITESQLKDRIAEIDLRDGQLDGKYAQVESGVCPECGHKN